MHACFIIVVVKLTVLRSCTLDALGNAVTFYFYYYRVASNYGRSRINAWSHLVAKVKSYWKEINTRAII